MMLKVTILQKHITILNNNVISKYIKAKYDWIIKRIGQIHNDYRGFISLSALDEADKNLKWHRLFKYHLKLSKIQKAHSVLNN